MGPAGFQALAEILLAVVAIGSILVHFGKRNAGHDDLNRRVESLEEAVEVHTATMAGLDKGLALLNQTIGHLNETLTSFPCRGVGGGFNRRSSDCHDDGSR